MMKKRILVVEDQVDNRRILRDLLTNADYEIIEAENGEEALAAAAAHLPDLILMDIQLPILDGYRTGDYRLNNLASHLFGFSVHMDLNALAADHP